MQGDTRGSRLEESVQKPRSPRVERGIARRLRCWMVLQRAGFGGGDSGSAGASRRYSSPGTLGGDARSPRPRHQRRRGVEPGAQPCQPLVTAPALVLAVARGKLQWYLQ